MTLNELRYIVAVAQERNFRRAAERVFISQPALSLAIQKLEEELNVKIFERNKIEMSVTETGEKIVAQAQRVLEEAAKIRQIAAGGQNQLAGSLKLGVIYTVGPYLLPELIPALKEMAPGMSLEVEENLTSNLEISLENGRLDAIVIALPFGGQSIATQALFDEDFNVLVPADHPWAKKASINAKELASEKVLMLDSGHCFSNQVAEACPELGRGEVRQGNSLETIRNMVASGLGITVLPASANNEKYRSRLTCAIEFEKPAPARRIALAWRKSFAREKAIEVLAQAIAATTMPGISVIR